jgi:hypothetical protein
MNDETTPAPGISDAGTMIFLCGADMHPLVARQRYPRGRFIEIARATRPLPGLDAFPGDGATAIWGILLRVPAQRAEGIPPIGVTLTSGLQTTAALGTRPEDIVDPASVLAAVRYWELPGAYRDAMATAIEG